MADFHYYYYYYFHKEGFAVSLCDLLVGLGGGGGFPAFCTALTYVKLL